MGRLVHILHTETKGGIFFFLSFSFLDTGGSSTATHKEFTVKRERERDRYLELCWE
jgi:hypothetical protein